MGFISGLGKVFSKVWEGVKKVATGPIGQTLLGMAGAAFGPLGSVAANVVTGLIANKGKLNLGSILSAGLSAFGPLAGKLGSVVQNLPSALKNPISLVTGILSGQSSLSQIAGDLVQKFLPKVAPIIDTITGFLGKGTKIGGDVTGVLGSVSQLLNNFNLNTDFLTRISEGISKVTGAMQGITDILNQLKGLPGGGIEMLRA